MHGFGCPLGHGPFSPARFPEQGSRVRRIVGLINQERKRQGDSFIHGHQMKLGIALDFGLVNGLETAFDEPVALGCLLMRVLSEQTV